MKTEKVIFDLDGTLLDTSLGIFESIIYAINKLNFPSLSKELFPTFIGPPLKYSFMRCLGCDEESAIQLMEAYREHYREGALLNAKPYDGIFDLCSQLKRRKIKMGVATSKPQLFSERILRHFGFDKYLDDIYGADLAGTLSKADLIRLCVGSLNPNTYIMVGDTESDAKGARECGVPFVAVSYGFGKPDKMEEYPMLGIADTPYEVLRIIEESEGK